MGRSRTAFPKIIRKIRIFSVDYPGQWPHIGLVTAIMPGKTRDKIMFITESTYYGLEYVAHATAEAGVAYLLDRIGSDHANDFWTTDGKTISTNDASLDFIIWLHDSPGDAVQALGFCDPDVMLAALRLLADAIEAGLKAGLE